MALRNIVQDGDPILKKVCRPVTEFNEKLAQLLDDMGRQWFMPTAWVLPVHRLVC